MLQLKLIHVSKWGRRALYLIVPFAVLYDLSWHLYLHEYPSAAGILYRLVMTNGNRVPYVSLDMSL